MSACVHERRHEICRFMPALLLHTKSTHCKPFYAPHTYIYMHVDVGADRHMRGNTKIHTFGSSPQYEALY